MAGHRANPRSPRSPRLCSPRKGGEKLVGGQVRDHLAPWEDTELESEVARPLGFACIWAARPWGAPYRDSGWGMGRMWGMGRVEATRTAQAPCTLGTSQPTELKAHSPPHPRGSRAPHPRRAHQVGTPSSGQRTGASRGRAPPPGPNPPGLSPPGLSPPGAPNPGGEGETLAPNLPKLGGPGRARSSPITCAAIKDRSMVSLLLRLLPPPALESSLLLLVQPPAQLARSAPSSERASPDLGSPGAAPRAQPDRCPRLPQRPRLQTATGRRARGARAGGAGLRGPGSPPRDHSQPHPRGRGRRNPRAHSGVSVRAAWRN